MNLELYLEDYRSYLQADEKSPNTISKYLLEAKLFVRFAAERTVTKSLVVDYKNELIIRYKPSSVNSKLAAVNSFLGFLKLDNYRVKPLRIQKQIFVEEEKVLTLEDYQKLKNMAGDRKISYIIETVACTGIRVSELRHITAESVIRGYASISCKGKNRIVLITATLRDKLLRYMKEKGVSEGPIFVTRRGRPLDRTAVWRLMKKLCLGSGVKDNKVYPHNLRHLFARLFYEESNDIVKLADVLGHSSINTTRIYMIETEKKHLAVLDKVNERFDT